MAGIAIAVYTDTSAVRGAIGLTDNEVTDDMIVDSRLDLELESDLYEWLPTHEDVWEAGSAVAATADEKMQKTWLRLYSKWFVASKLAAMILAMPQMISDGKAEMRRFQQLDLQKVLDNAIAEMMKYRDKLDAAVNGSTVGTAPTLVGLATPSYDPVTNT